MSDNISPEQMKALEDLKMLYNVSTQVLAPRQQHIETEQIATRLEAFIKKHIDERPK